MDIELANEIIACLPKDRTVFDYYKDRYAVMLLERVVGDGMAVAEIKQTRFGKLLNRPLVKHVVARKGDGVLTRDDLIYLTPPPETEHYVLTLGVWGGTGYCFWDQTSRKGVNLVLQLNFSRAHDRQFVELFDKQERTWFRFIGHPVCRRGRNTLAWARIDIDFDADAALVEEVQTDWLRCAKDLAHRNAHTARFGAPGERSKAQRFVDYHDKILANHRRLWSEAMLAAAIWFLFEEIGIGRVWYHDAETGARLKRIKHTKPPRSLYTDLPRKLCFDQVRQAPPFVTPTAPRAFKRSLKTGNARFWHMAV